MPVIAIAPLASITAAEALTLVLPVAVVLVAVAWYTWMWLRDEGR